MVRVTFDADLPERSKSKQKHLSIQWEAGMTVASLLKREGFTLSEREAMLAAVNGEHKPLDTSLSEGDEVLVTMAIQGGSLACSERSERLQFERPRSWFDGLTMSGGNLLVKTSQAEPFRGNFCRSS